MHALAQAQLCTLFGLAQTHVNTGHTPWLVLEMFSLRQQPLLTDYMTGRIKMAELQVCLRGLSQASGRDGLHGGERKKGCRSVTHERECISL